MKFTVAVLLSLLAVASPAAAGPFNDKLAICLVKETSESDKTTLIRWIFAAMASHPSVKDLGNVSEAQGKKLNKDVSVLFFDLLSNRCGAETKDAVKYEGAAAISSSFEVLGKVAMQGLMEDAKVSEYMAGMGANLDPKAMEELFGKPSQKP
jgi:hypothetical protein